MVTIGSRLWNPSGVANRLVQVLLVCAVYYIGGVVGLALRIRPTDMSVIWPPNAILLAVLLLSPIRVWWLFLLALLPTHLLLLSTVRNDAPPAVMLFHFAGAAIQSTLAAIAVRYLAGAPPRLIDLRRMTLFLGYAAILAPVIAGAVVASVYFLIGWQSDFWMSWQARVLANVFPTLTITPLILELALGESPIVATPSGRRKIEYALLSVVLLVLSLSAFGTSQGLPTQHALMVAPLPLLLWSAVRFGYRGLCPHLLAIAVISLMAAKAGKGPFQSNPAGEGALGIQVYLLVVSVPFMMLTALVSERNRSVRALRESANRLHMATAAGKVGVWDWNLESNELYVDPALKANLGYRDDEIRNHLDDWARHMHSEDAALVQEKLRQYVNGECILFEAERRMMHRDGSVRWFIARGAAVEHKNGSPSRILGTDTDITERKRVENALIENEARYRAIVEDQTELICRFRRDGTYTFVNDAYCRYFQCSREELVGQSFWRFIPPEKHEITRSSLESATPENPVSTCEHEVIAPGGVIRWQQWRNRGFFDEQGRAVEFQAVGRDVTELRRAEAEHRELEARKHAEETLQQSEARFRELADSMPQIAWTAQSDGSIDYFNRRWYETTNVPQGLTGPEGWLPVVHMEDRQLCVDRWAEAVRTGQQFQCEARFLCGTGGTYRWHLTRALPLVDRSGRIVRWYGTSTDIDDQKRAEQHLLDAARHKDEFLAMLAHELRNPLGSIDLAVTMMKRHELPEPIEWARDVVGRQVTQLTRLVDDLLDVSRITRGKIKLSMTMVELDGIIAQAVETCRPLIETRRHVLSLVIRQRSLQVLGDEVRLAQVISNLLNNAAKYTPEEGRIQLTVAQVDSDVVVTVKDNGLGIPPDMLGQIFDPFVQIENTRDRSQGGLGIGLTLVNQLVQLHGGCVEARSEGLGKGCEFEIRLPVPIAQQQGIIPIKAPEPEIKKVSPSELRVLIVDDNVDLAETLRRLLCHHEVRVVHDGIAALENARAFHPDVVVLDIGLPKMDGFQVAKRIRQQEFGSHPLLIAMTGFGQDDDRRMAAEAGFDHHLVKPIDPHQLEKLLAQRGAAMPLF